MAMLDLVSLPTLQLGLPFLAVTLGFVHAVDDLDDGVRAALGLVEQHASV